MISNYCERIMVSDFGVAFIEYVNVGKNRTERRRKHSDTCLAL